MKKKFGVAVLISDKIDFKTKAIKKDKNDIKIKMIKKGIMLKRNTRRRYYTCQHICTQYRNT